MILAVTHFALARILMHIWHIVDFESLYSLVKLILDFELNWIDAKPHKIFFWMLDFRHFAKSKHLERKFGIHATFHNVSVLT